MVQEEPTGGAPPVGTREDERRIPDLIHILDFIHLEGGQKPEPKPEPPEDIWNPGNARRVQCCRRSNPNRTPTPTHNANEPKQERTEMPNTMAEAFCEEYLITRTEHGQDFTAGGTEIFTGGMETSSPARAG